MPRELYKQLSFVSVICWVMPVKLLFIRDRLFLWTRALKIMIALSASARRKTRMFLANQTEMWSIE